MPFKKRTARSGRVEGARHLARGLRIVHEDDDLLVIDKPAGMLTAGEVGGTGESVFNYLKDYVRDAARRRGTRVWIVHRLDKEASGLLVFAKSEPAFGALKADFKSKRVHRLYAAVVEGEIKSEGDGEHAGTVASYLWEDERGVMHSTLTPSVVGRHTARGSLPMRAVTHFRVRRAGHGRSLLAVRLESGRKNQIRVHMQDIKHPIVGDRRYGAATDPLGRVCLHAAELGFTHPGTGKSVRYVSEPPGAFVGLVGEEERHQGAEAAGHQGEEKRGVEGSWDEVAGWYDGLLEERGSDHHERLIVPGVLRLIGPVTGARVLDVACGQGFLCRRLAGAGCGCVGVDASEELIRRAKAAGGEACEYLVGDARGLGGLSLRGDFDAAACVMALMNIEPMGPVVEGVASLLREGGRLVAVILHPAFRSPGRTAWGWEEEGTKAGRHEGTKGGGTRQYRRVDAYLSEERREIVMNPGAVAHGAAAVKTATYHRPVRAYVEVFARAGLLVDAMEEWASVRISEPGPRAAEENRARREIPMFLALRGVKLGRGVTPPGPTGRPSPPPSEGPPSGVA